jgi:hypothetical protein
MRLSNTAPYRDTHALTKEQFLSLSKTISERCSEQNIIDLHNEFLHNGFHYLCVKDILVGRHIMHTFLYSLNYYQSVGCLTISSFPLCSSIENIYETLSLYGYLNKNYLSDFFIQEWYFDFIWIEATDELLNASWFSLFLQYIKDFKCDAALPIFVLSYCNRPIEYGQIQNL